MKLRLSDITSAITQVAANKLKIKIDAKCDLGSSHCSSKPLSRGSLSVKSNEIDFVLQN